MSQQQISYQHTTKIIFLSFFLEIWFKKCMLWLGGWKNSQKKSCRIVILKVFCIWKSNLERLPIRIRVEHLITGWTRSGFAEPIFQRLFHLDLNRLINKHHDDVCGIVYFCVQPNWLIVSLCLRAKTFQKQSLPVFIFCNILTVTIYDLVFLWSIFK